MRSRTLRFSMSLNSFFLCALGFHTRLDLEH